jgi:hypothetical protein
MVEGETLQPTGGVPDLVLGVGTPMSVTRHVISSWVGTSSVKKQRVWHTRLMGPGGVCRGTSGHRVQRSYGVPITAQFILECNSRGFLGLVVAPKLSNILTERGIYVPN